MPPASAVMSAAPGLFDQTDQRTLGLAVPATQTSILYEAKESGWRFSHTANLVVFKNRLHAMWSSGRVHEDAQEQRLMRAWSDDGVTWSEPDVLLEPGQVRADGEGALMSAGWLVIGERLHAFATWSHGRRFDRLELSRLYAMSSEDAVSWGPARLVVPGTFLEPARWLGGKNWVLAGQGANHQPIFYHAERPDATERKTVTVPENPAYAWPEPSMFRRPDGGVTCVLRVRPKHGCLYACESLDGGLTWSEPVATDYPSATARTCAGNLPDGRAYLIGNPNTGVNRDITSHGNRGVLAIATSRDGRVFDRAHALRIDPAMLKFAGKAKMGGFQYPNAVIFKEHMYVAHTIGKEDVGVVRFEVAEL